MKYQVVLLLVVGVALSSQAAPKRKPPGLQKRMSMLLDRMKEEHLDDHDDSDIGEKLDRILKAMCKMDPSMEYCPPVPSLQDQVTMLQQQVIGIEAVVESLVKQLTKIEGGQFMTDMDKEVKGELVDAGVGDMDMGMEYRFLDVDALFLQFPAEDYGLHTNYNVLHQLILLTIDDVLKAMVMELPLALQKRMSMLLDRMKEEHLDDLDDSDIGEKLDKIMKALCKIYPSMDNCPLVPSLEDQVKMLQHQVIEIGSESEDTGTPTDEAETTTAETTTTETTTTGTTTDDETGNQDATTPGLDLPDRRYRPGAYPKIDASLDKKALRDRVLSMLSRQEIRELEEITERKLANNLLSLLKEKKESKQDHIPYIE